MKIYKALIFFVDYVFKMWHIYDLCKLDMEWLQYIVILFYSLQIKNKLSYYNDFDNDKLKNTIPAVIFFILIEPLFHTV